MMERFAAQTRIPQLQVAFAVLLLGCNINLRADDTPLSETRLEDLGPDAFFQLGQQVTGQVCTLCHGWDMVLSNRHTYAEWSYLINDMVARGASATTEQQEFIARFMTWAWGKVAVNTASAVELSAVIGIPKSQADAIVAYRTANGPIADLAGLKQVPGIDVAALDRQADALQFH